MDTLKTSFVTRIFDGGDIYFVRGTGVETPSISRENTARLAERIHHGGYKGLVIDFRGLTFEHDETQFDHLTGRTAHLFPDELVTAFIYGARQKPHAIMMIRALQAGGMMAGAFKKRADALSWVRDCVLFRTLSGRTLSARARKAGVRPA